MKLVIQSHTLSQQQVQHIAQLAGTDRIEAIESSPYPAFRLLDAELSARDLIGAYCDQHDIDYAYIDPAKKLSDFGLVVMDMDSTLINIECIDEIADMQGIKHKVAEITERSMRGELDFAQSLRERVALLAGLDQSALGRVYEERLRLNPGAERMLQAAHAAGLKSLLVSGGFTFFTERLQTRLNLTQAHANVLEIVDGKLTGKVASEILDAQAKKDWLIKLRTELGLRPDQVIALGDGANDLKMLVEAGVGIAYHAKPIVRQQAGYALTHVGLDGLLNWFA